MTPQEKLYRAWLKAGKPKSMPPMNHRLQARQCGRMAELVALMATRTPGTIVCESPREAKKLMGAARAIGEGIQLYAMHMRSTEFES